MALHLHFPAPGATLPVTQVVTFSGSADDVATISVKIVVDGKFNLGIVPVINGAWFLPRKFSATGTRQVQVTGFNAAGALTGTINLAIKLVEPVVAPIPHESGYHPPAATRAQLGGVLDLLESAPPLHPGLQGLEYMCKLPGGQLFFESDLDLDTDGKQDPTIRYESTHQPSTSLSNSIDSNVVPYIVLPSALASAHGIALGDLAAVLFNGKVAFAIYADNGPSSKIGEGSIELHRLLGFERIRPNRRIHDVGIDRDVVTIVFPGSGNGTPKPVGTIATEAMALFKAIGGAP